MTRDLPPRTTQASVERHDNRFCVHLERGNVIEVNGQPMETWEEADAVRRKILETTGERGEVARVWVLT